jgi:hypothetical protein
VKRALFPLGQVVATPGAIAVMERLGINPAGLLARHVTGDWGDIAPEDRGLNEQALIDGSRIFSVYGERGSDGCLWVITEAVSDEPSGYGHSSDGTRGPITEAQDDAGRRSATTILRPADY